MLKAQAAAAPRRRAHKRAPLIAVAVAAIGAVAAPAARAITVSPLNGTPDASPSSQISFLGVPATQISDVSVVGSRSGRHNGTLRAYASAPGASFLPTHPFVAGERVAVGANVGPAHTHVSSSFYIAQQLPNAVAATSASAPAKPGTVQSFVSQPALRPPELDVTTHSSSAGHGDLFLTPTHGSSQSGTMIADESGRLVWFQPVAPGTLTTNLQVQRYEGRPVLVWWQGHVADGVGWGEDEIYSSSYTPVAQIAAGNGYEADLHAVQITPQGSAFITAYSLVRADLSSAGGSRNGILQDAVLQEIDIKTGLVMFEWHADGHVALNDSYEHLSPSDYPWDYFHINAISLDPWGDGNFIISSRNTWAGYEIDHETGAILWRLGGKRSSFRMAAGTVTAWQHDIAWQPDHTLTAFDNGAVPKVHSQSRVIRERINWKQREVQLVNQDVHTPAILSGSQGDDQVLSDGDSLVGWGEQPDITEFSASGAVVFDAHLPAPTQSYRAFRFPWSATPASPPAIAVRRSGADVTVYASWNGATGVSSWRVLVVSGTGTLEAIGSAPRSGFETAITVERGPSSFVVQALGAQGEVLGTSASALA